jgi:hypothetical protein
MAAIRVNDTCENAINGDKWRRNLKSHLVGGELALSPTTAILDLVSDQCIALRRAPLSVAARFWIYLIFQDEMSTSPWEF